MKLFFSSYILYFVSFLFFFLINKNEIKADNLTNIIDKIENGTLTIQPQNSKQSHQLSFETYAGMIGNKEKSATITLDLSLEHRENGSLLIVNGKNINNQNVIKTSFQQNPTRFFIDVFFQPKQEKVVNFTYRLPRDIRLKYGLQQFGGYRIALDFPENTKILSKNVATNEIAVKFSNAILEKKLIDKQNKQKNINKKNTSQPTKTITKDENITIIDNFEGLKRVSDNANFKYIANENNKKITIAIDAGHGGIDPGTIGKRKVPEKTITLMYAKRLKEVLQKKGFNAILTRENDKTLQLTQRVEIARKHNADVFISLHTDAHSDNKVKGTTVYRLSHLDTQHPDWNRFRNKTYLPDQYTNYMNNANILDILISMTHQSLLEKSAILAENVLLEMKKDGICNPCRHGQRSLAVLRGLNMTSILIELGYITNADEEIKLLSASNVDKFANNIASTLAKTYQVKIPAKTQQQTANQTKTTQKQPINQENKQNTIQNTTTTKPKQNDVKNNIANKNNTQKTKTSITNTTLKKTNDVKVMPTNNK